MQWAGSYGSLGNDVAHGVVVDSKGNSTFAGSIGGPISFGGPTLTVAATENLFVASHSSSGSHRWSKSFGKTGTNAARALELDSSDNLYLGGEFEGNASFGGSTLKSAGGDDVVLASFTAGGVHRWSSRYGGPGQDMVYALARNSVTGEIFLTGRFTGSTSYGGSSFTSKGSWDTVVAGLTATGTHRWSRRMGGAGDDVGRGLVLDTLGHVNVVTDFDGSEDFGGGTVTSTAVDVVLARYSLADGTYGGHMQLGGAGSDSGSGVVMDAAGNTYIAGHFQNSLKLDATKTLTAVGNSDIFIASHSPGGGLRWSKQMGSTGVDYGFHLAIDAGGNVYFAGTFSDKVSFDGATLTSAGGFDILAASFSASGTLRWSKRLGATGDEGAFGVAVSASGAVYLTGAFSGAADIGNGPVASKGGYDAFVIKLTQQ